MDVAKAFARKIVRPLVLSYTITENDAKVKTGYANQSNLVPNNIALTEEHTDVMATLVTLSDYKVLTP